MTDGEKRAIREIQPELLVLAQTRAPQEACGILEYDGERLYLHACENVSPEPETAFLIGTRDQMRALARIDRHGTAYWGIFHSHPSTNAQPSLTDRAFAEHVGKVYWVILGLKPTDSGDVCDVWAGFLS